MQTLLAGLTCSLLTAPLAFADLLVVGPPESGAAFTDLQTAIDAAEPDDRIQLLPGTYGQANVTKPLRIFGSGPDEVVIDNTPFVNGALRVTELGFGESFHLAGVTVIPGPFGTQPFGVQATDCLGTVSLENVVVRSSAERASGLLVERCQLVLASDCEFESSSPIAPTILSGLLPAVRAVDSNLVLENCTATGASQTQGPVTTVFAEAFGQPAVDALRSRVAISGGTFTGGDGGFADNLPEGLPGGPAVRQVSGSLTVAGGARLFGGDGGQSVTSPEAPGGPGGAGLAVFGTVDARLDPTVELVGGDGFDPDVAAPELELGALASVQQLDAPIPTLASAEASVPGLIRVELTAAGLPDTFLFPLVDLQPAGPFLVPTQFVFAAIDPATSISLLPIALDGQGAGSRVVQTLADPALVGLGAVFQGYEVGAPGVNFRLGLPTVTTLRLE